MSIKFIIFVKLKMKMTMENKLLENGFIKNENEYIKGNWTIRFDNDIIEVFNNPDIEPGRYYIGPIKLIDIDTILEEIL